MILMGFMTTIVISARMRKLMNRLHMEQAISSHRPPNSIAFKTFHVMIVIHDDENMAVHHSENNICSYRTSGCFLYTNKQLLFGIFTKCHLFVCFWTNNYNLSQKWEWCQLEMNTKVEWWKMNKWLCVSWRKHFAVFPLKTRNWTQRIILKHLKPEDVGMLTLSSFLNATAGGCGHIPDLLLLFVIVVLIFVLIVLMSEALICAVDHTAIVMTKLNLEK